MLRKAGGDIGSFCCTLSSLMPVCQELERTAMIEPKVERHGILRTGILKLKILLLCVGRIFRNLRNPVEKFAVKFDLAFAPVIALSESNLWNPLDTDENRILTAGKIANLRIAVRSLNGIEVRAGQIFSFWRHIGNPNFGKGFVLGREIREGCIVPTIAGGLCQLSNALYEAALQADFEIVERHRHSVAVAGSAAEYDRDATVKWNYVDLRFRSNEAFRIEIELTHNKLLLSFRGHCRAHAAVDLSKTFRRPTPLNDCYSCGNAACYKHPKPGIMRGNRLATTFVLDAKWPEFDNYVQGVAAPEDYFIVPWKPFGPLHSKRYRWSACEPKRTYTTTIAYIRRYLKLRQSVARGNNIFSTSLDVDRMIAQAAARRIPVTSSRLVVAQNLLPFLFEAGVLGGREFDVLMTRLPFEALQARLDELLRKYPGSPTLNDFRAPVSLIEAENRALTQARRIITPHAEVGAMFQNKAHKLDWILPRNGIRFARGLKILFPASAVARKGCYEMKQLAAELNLTLVVAGGAVDYSGFWGETRIENFNGNWDDIGLVIYPAYIEHQPRRILQAVSKGIPVITTRACGLNNFPQVQILESGDYPALKAAVKSRLVSAELAV
ncbi:MAG: VanW family protein [Spirochaetes bacterium]|nr:VanW family protein [Spirochaetota bacterium]